MKAMSHLVTLSITISVAVAFTISSQHATVRYPTQMLSVPKPSIVSVCTAELCCCQENGLGGHEILADLQSRNLPYTIDDTPCLGACGGGAMVAIDFEDGTSALVSGLEETLAELGLTAGATPSAQKPEAVPVTEEVSVTKLSPSQLEILNDATPAVSLEEKEVKESPQLPTVRMQQEKLNDARERMRAEAAENQQNPNPWLNAASYLAGKAAEKIFGEK